MRPSDYAVEPPRVPKLTAISQLDWYCLDPVCATIRRSENDIRSHVMAAHFSTYNPDIENEVHYARGTRLLMMQITRHKWECDQEERLSLHLQSLGGADDFLAEVELAKERNRGWGERGRTQGTSEGVSSELEGDS